jgi:hypothetical protein
VTSPRSGGNWGTINRATVKGIGPQGGVLVEVPAFAPGGTMGPIPTCVPNLAIGEAVLVANISTSRDTLVVIGRVPGRADTMAEIPNLMATITALQTADSSAASRLTSAEGRLTSAEGRLTTDEANIATNTSNLASHVHTSTPGAYAVGGNETVGGTLGVTGAATVGSLNAGSGNITTTGAVNTGTLTATGAVAGASVAATNAATAHGGNCTTASLIAGQHTQYVSKIIGAAAAVQTRSNRQPVVHGVRQSGLSLAITSTETSLFTANFVNKEDCNHLYAFTIGTFVNAGAGTNVEPSDAYLRLKVVDNPGGTVRFDSGQIFRAMGAEYYQYSSQREQPRTSINHADTYLWTAGSGFQIQIWGQLQTVLGSVIDLVNGFVMEVVTVD